MSTRSGTLSSAAFTMCSRTAALDLGDARPPRTSNTSSSCTCMMRRAGEPARAHQASTAIMARLMMSAAVPCMGALMALRSAYWRSWALPERMSGRYRRRPDTVST